MQLRRMADAGFAGIARSLFQFSLPLILSGVLQQLYSWADAFIVGRVEGELALAAVGATGTVVNLFLTIITGFTLGLSILCAQKYGSGERSAIPQILATFSLLFAVLFLFLAAAGALLSLWALRLLHTPPDALPLAEAYLRIVFAGIPFLAVYNVFSAALRGLGDSRTPFIAVLISSLVNIALDVVLVACLHWGVGGAALATVLSQAAMTLFLVIYSRRKHPLLRFHPGLRMLNRRALSQGLRMGFPPMIQSSVSAFGGLILQNFMNGFGTQTVAAITTAYRVDSIILLPIINLGSGISTLVAQSYGANDGPRARKTFIVGLAAMLAVSLLLTLLIIPTGGALIAMFGAGPEAIRIGRDFFHRIASFYVVFGLATAARGFLEGLGDVVFSSIAGMVSLCVRIAASYAMAGLFGNMVIAYAEAFSWIVLLILYLLRLMSRRRQRQSAGLAA